MATPVALITGAGGQDAYYLAHLLQAKGYLVYGIERRSGGAVPLYAPCMSVVEGDVTDPLFVRDLVEKIKPRELYNLAALTHVGESFKVPKSVIEVNTLGALSCLQAAEKIQNCRVYQASTSELFGDSPPPQNEETPMRPRSPYAVSKLAAHWLTRNYRERGLYACASVLFNHESPIRGEDFVTRKTTKMVARIKRGCPYRLSLGNLDARRDWGFAGDYVEAIWLSMQESDPDEYVVATGIARSVREMVALAFDCAGIRDWEDHVEVDERLFRPLEVESLRGNPEKIRTKLGWKPKVQFEEMIERMVWADLKRVSGQALRAKDLMIAGSGWDVRCDPVSAA